ncbi:MAG: NYN domain-containing protein [Bacteroidota bacterium]
MKRECVAVYLDFENLAISAETSSTQINALQIKAIMEFAATKGNICLKQAYADWSKDLFAQYQNTLLELGFELIHLPSSNLQGKNGADVRLAIDVIEHLHKHIEIQTILIGSGDSDFIPLMQRLQARNKEVVIVGFEHSVAQLIKRNSAEFKSMESLIHVEGNLTEKPQQNGSGGYGREVLEKTIQSRKIENPILLARLKQQMLRVDPGFSEKKLGYSSFKSFLLALEGDLVEKIEPDENDLPKVYFTRNHATEFQEHEFAKTFLFKKIRYKKDRTQRLQISSTLVENFDNKGMMSMDEMFDVVHVELNHTLSKADIRKYINTLFTGGAFEFDSHIMQEPLLLRPLKLKESVTDKEILDQLYIQRVIEILQKRYQSLDDKEILELLV